MLKVVGEEWKKRHSNVGVKGKSKTGGKNQSEISGRRERSKERPGSATSSLATEREAERTKMWEEEPETDTEDAKSIISTKTRVLSLEKRNSGSIGSKSRKSRSKSGERSRLGEMLRSRLGRRGSSEVERSRLGGNEIGRSRSEECMIN